MPRESATQSRRLSRKKRRPYRLSQRMALPYLRSTQHPALIIEMRLGKTLLVIRSLDRLPGRFLIVAPSSALGSWEDEFAIEGIPSDQVVLLRGTRKKRLSLLEEGRRWNLINPEGHRALPEIADVSWDAVVIDESTTVRNPTAAITKFFLRNFRDVPQRWIMTGTVNPESDLDMWCQFAFLDGRAFGASTYWSFRARNYKPSVTGFGWTPRRGTQTKIRKMLSERAFILRRKDCGSDVEKVYERRRVELPPKIRKQYDIIEEEFTTPTRDTKYAVTKYHWLRQLCGGFIDGKMVWDGKLQEILYLLRGDLQGDPLIVWFFYNQEITEAVKCLKKRKYEVAPLMGEMPLSSRKKAISDFRSGYIQILLAQQAIAQMGVNFSRSDAAIYYSTPVSALGRQQTEDRIVDIERKTPHLILDLCVPGTVDEDAVDLVQDKKIRGAWTLERARMMAVKRVGA